MIDVDFLETQPAPDKTCAETKNERSGPPEIGESKNSPSSRSALTPFAEERGFPVLDLAEVESCGNPLGAIRSANSALRKGKTYLDVREAYCQANIKMNLEGKIAPAFRPELNLGKPLGRKDYMILHRDNMVIDLTWLQCCRYDIKVPNKDWGGLIDGNMDIDFESAWDFSSLEWTSTYRAEVVLGLRGFHQCQVRTLNSDLIKHARKSIVYGGIGSGKQGPAKIAAFRMVMNRWIEEDPRMERWRDDYEGLWMARELLTAASSTGKAAVRSIAKLAALMNGTEFLDDKTVREKLRKLDKHLGSK